MVEKECKRLLRYYFDRLRCFFIGLGDFVLFVSSIFRDTLFHFPSSSLCITHFHEMGVRSLPIMGVTGIATGLILAAQSYFTLSEKGLAGVTGIMVTKAILTELGPILTGFMITGRVGAAMCAEIGTMRVTEQIDALYSMSVNPLHYLVIPRFISATLLFPLLTACSSLLGVMGGYVISVYSFHLSSSDYLSAIPFHVSLFDYFSGLIKSLIFGLLIVFICCYRGIKTEGGAEGVGKMTTKSVVSCYASILIVDFFLTLLLQLVKKGVR